MRRSILIACLAFLCVSALGAPLKIEATGFVQKSIYHSPEARGYTAWCTLWASRGGDLNLAFQQVTGPVADWHKRVNVTVVLSSTDDAKNWKKQREVPARAGTRDEKGIYAAPGSASFCGHGMAVLDDGTLVAGLWAGGDENTGYVQRSTDNGKTWSPPIHLADPAVLKVYPTQIHRLHDGRLMLVAGVVKQADAKTALWLLKEFFESTDGGKSWIHVWTMPADVGLCEESDFAEHDNGDLFFVHRAEHYESNKYITSDRLQNVFHRNGGKWEIGPVTKSPFPHGGFPELLKTSEGVILHIATDGTWWTADAGQHWARLDLPASPYYPEAVQLKDGTILVVGHVGGDNVYGSVDQTIVQQTYHLVVDK